MAKIQFENGTVVEFDGDPTPEDVDFVGRQIGLIQEAPAAEPKSSAPYAMFGPMARGIEALQKGITLQDSPYVARKMISGFAQGGPENIAARPLDFAMGGVPGVQASPFSKPQVPDILPQPATPEGKRFGDQMGTAAGFFPLVEGLQALLNPAKAAVAGSKAAQSLGRATKGAPDFAEKVRDAFYDLPRQFGEKFGSQVDKLESANPNKLVNIGTEISQLADDARANSDVARRISLGLKKLGDPDIAKQWDNLLSGKFFKGDWTLSESQKFIRAIKNAPGMAGKLSKAGARFDPNEIPLLEFYGNVRGRQIEAFPEFSDTLKEFAGKMQDFNKVRGNFKFGQTIKKVLGGFGDTEVENAVSNILPKELVNEIGGVRKAASVLKALKRAGITAGIGIAGGSGFQVARNLFGGPGGES